MSDAYRIETSRSIAHDWGPVTVKTAGFATIAEAEEMIKTLKTYRADLPTKYRVVEDD